MISIQEELKSFKEKVINDIQLPLDDLYNPLTEVESKLNNIYKTNKKNVLAMELFKEELRQKISKEIEEKNKEIYSLKRVLEEKEARENKIAKKIIIVLDQMEAINRFAVQSQNEGLLDNLHSLMKVIRKELREIELEEIPTVGEIFNSELHECIESVKSDTKNQYEIVDVIKKGYKINGKVIRIASVIVVK